MILALGGAGTMCFLHESHEMCANNKSEKRIVWMMLLIAGIGGLVLSPRGASPSIAGHGEAVAGVTSSR